MSKNKIILVSSFPRSGTHFMIDALRLNIDGAVFPVVKKWPSDFNYGGLFRNSDVVNQFFQKEFATNRWTIVKSHLLPSESRIGAFSDSFSQETRALFRKIWAQSIKLYMYRDPRDTLISYYHLNNRNIDFSSFLQSPNTLDKFSIRVPQEHDANKVLFWREHVEQWLNIEGVHFVKYEDLRDNFEGILDKVLSEDCKVNIPVNIRRPRKDNDASFWARFKNNLRALGVAHIPVDSTNYVGTPRRGGWADYYTEQDKKMFPGVTMDLMQKLGYSKSIW